MVRCRVGASTLLIALSVLVAAPANAAEARRAQRLAFLGPSGNFHCGTGEILAGEPTDIGFAIVKQSPGVVRATVALRNLQPNTAYAVRLIQVSELQTDCHAGESVVVTNPSGNATIHLSEPVAADTIGFNIAVNTGTIFGAPHYVGDRTVPAE